LLLVGCGAALKSTPGSSTTGKASWYGGRFHGRKTASGERFDKHAMTAAHRKLPFGTRVRVTSLNTGRSVEVRINDRGPFGRRDRIIDLSEGAAEVLGMKSAGVVTVKLEVLSVPETKQ
jgi:rare lipoprotein A